MSDSNDTTPTKTCTKCGQVCPATNDYFYKQKGGKYGLTSYCKPCGVIRSMKWNTANPERKKENSKRFYESNSERLRAKNRQFYADNIEKCRSQVRRWRHNNIEKSRAATCRSMRNNKVSVKTSFSRRRARRQALPDAFTPEQCKSAIEYFHGCCAVCGRQCNDLFGTHTLAMDHWIPLSDPRPDNPGTVASNIVPLCHGQSGCNNSKGSKPPESWLIGKFGKRRATVILKRIHAYFESISGDDLKKAA